MLPLDASVATRMVAPRPSLAAGRTDFTWNGPVTGTPNGDAPSILNASFTFRANVEVPAGGGEGVIVTQGGRFGGYGFYVLKGRPVFVYNFFRSEADVLGGREHVGRGPTHPRVHFNYEGMGAETLAFNNTSGIGRGGKGVLEVDGKEVATEAVEATMPLLMQFDENFDIGSDTGTPVSDDYGIPFKFTGKLDKLTLHIDRPQLTPANEQKLKEMSRNKQAVSDQRGACLARTRASIRTCTSGRRRWPPLAADWSGS